MIARVEDENVIEALKERTAETGVAQVERGVVSHGNSEVTSPVEGIVIENDVNVNGGIPQTTETGVEVYQGPTQAVVSSGSVRDDYAVEDVEYEEVGGKLGDKRTDRQANPEELEALREQLASKDAQINSMKGIIDDNTPQNRGERAPDEGGATARNEGAANAEEAKGNNANRALVTTFISDALRELKPEMRTALFDKFLMSDDPNDMVSNLYRQNRNDIIDNPKSWHKHEGKMVAALTDELMKDPKKMAQYTEEITAQKDKISAGKAKKVPPVIGLKRGTWEAIGSSLAIMAIDKLVGGSNLTAMLIESKLTSMATGTDFKDVVMTKLGMQGRFHQFNNHGFSMS